VVIDIVEVLQKQLARRSIVLYVKYSSTFSFKMKITLKPLAIQKNLVGKFLSVLFMRRQLRIKPVKGMYKNFGMKEETWMLSTHMKYSKIYKLLGYPSNIQMVS
jgi:hypothetical protein